MKAKPKSKSFDCVAFKREAQARIYRLTKNMTPEKEITFLERRAEKTKLGNWWTRVKSGKPKVSTRRPSA